MSKQLEHYAKTVIPEPYTILGVKLHPLSLGHLILMKRFNCAFGADEIDRSGTLLDLLIAIAICGRKYEEFIEWFANEKERDDWLNKWYKSITKEAKKNEHWYLVNKFSMFNMYRKENISIPLYFEGEENENDRESGAHWIQNVISTLTMKGRCSEKEVMDIPVSKALADYFKILENEGRITLMQDWELEAAEKAEKEAKEKVNG